jgi:hypothetical protein
MSRIRSRIAMASAPDDGDEPVRSQRRIAMNGSRDHCLALVHDPELTREAAIILARRQIPTVTRYLVSHPVVTKEMVPALLRYVVDDLARQVLIERFDSVPPSQQFEPIPVCEDVAHRESEVDETMNPNDAYAYLTEMVDDVAVPTEAAANPTASYAGLDDDLYRLLDEVARDFHDDESFDRSLDAPSTDERVYGVLARMFGTDVHHPAFTTLHARLASGSPIGRLAQSLNRLLEEGHDDVTILTAYELRNEWQGYFGRSRHAYLSWDTAVRLVEVADVRDDVVGAWGVVEGMLSRFNRGGDGESRTFGHYLARVVDDYHTSMLRGGHMPLDSLLG